MAVFFSLPCKAAFFAPLLLYPEHYGARGASVRQLAALTHVWRVFGYYLGIAEESNAGQFSPERTLVVGRGIMEMVLKPCMLNLSDQSIAMAQTIFSEPTDYYVWVYRNYRMVGYPLNKLWQSFSWRQRLLYYSRSLWLDHLYNFSLVRNGAAYVNIVG